MVESDYQAKLIKKLRVMFPGCIILKTNPNYLQGVPDILILFQDRWAMLEVKAHARAPLQPNQDYYVAKLNEMSYAAFIYPSNEEDILRALRQTFGACRNTRDVRCE